MNRQEPGSSEHAGVGQTSFTRLLPVLAVVLLYMLGSMSIFEIMMLRWFSNLSPYQSQLLTILFSALVATSGIYIVVRSFVPTREHARTVKAQRESEERYRTLFERVPVGLYRTTADGQIVHANPALLEMLGYPDLESLLAMNARDIFANPEDRGQEMDILEQGDGPITAEIQLVRYDGSIIWVRDIVRAVRDEDGEIIYMEGSLENITERKQAEEAQSLLASIVKSSDDAIIGQTLDGKIVSWNSGAEKIFGYTEAEAVGRSLAILQPTDLAGELAKIMSKIKRGERVDHYETERIRKGGKRINVSLTFSPIHDATGKVIGVSKIARDISEHKKIEQYMLRTERLAAMGQITATLAHEVKNPLQAVQSNLELLLDFPLESDEREDCLQICQREIEGLIEITQRMLVFSRPDQSTYREVSIAEIWEETLALVGKKLQTAGVQLRSELPEELPVVRGAAGQLRQVLLNLVLNSTEAMAGGGHMCFSARQDGDQLVMRLVNNGPPIPAEHMERIFEPFFTSKPGGAGLGLFISHNIIQAHGGNLSVENLEDGTGVMFTISLPVAVEPGEDASATGTGALT